MSLLIWLLSSHQGCIQHYECTEFFPYQGPEYEKTIGECTCKNCKHT
uniref:Uncharacterized protein n=1 Tax=Anguilla anguilla TaxID=7936 RepID=A0A0E9SW15_ANGAN